MKWLLPYSAVVACGLGVVAIAFFILYVINFEFSGHYEIKLGPGWQIGLAALASAASLVLVFAAMVHKPSAGRLFLIFGLGLPALPIFFLALMHMAEQDNGIGDVVKYLLKLVFNST